MLPIIGIQETLQYMTGRPGIRYKESVAAMSGNAQFAPYKPARRSNFNLDLDFRTLETFFGSVVAQFEPNSAISTLLGAIGDTKGDGQMQTPTAKHVLALIAKSLSEALNNAIWAGVRNANGYTTLDLFDGFDTITSAEITDGKIAVSEGNYMKLDEAITTANAVDMAKSAQFSLDPHLRAQTCYMFCSQDFADKYRSTLWGACNKQERGLPSHTRRNPLGFAAWLVQELQHAVPADRRGRLQRQADTLSAGEQGRLQVLPRVAENQHARRLRPDGRHGERHGQGIRAVHQKKDAINY